MPSSKYIAKAREISRQFDKQQTMDQEFRGAIILGMAKKRISVVEMQSVLGLSSATFVRRRHNPDTITVGELRILAKELDFSLVQICEILGIENNDRR